MFKKIKRALKIWNLAEKDDKVLKAIESLAPETVKKLPSRGNGKAVFMRDMDQEALDKYRHEHQAGWKKFQAMVRNLTP